METYEQTHPWLTFSLNLTGAPWQLWLMAGEALSKFEHLSGVPVNPEAAKQLMTVYLAKGALATTAIEGNTLSEAEAIKRVEGTLKLPPSKEYLGLEIDNIVKATNSLLENIRKGKHLKLTPELICKFNGQVLENLTLEEYVEPGKLRTYSVGVADYRGAPASELPELLRKLCDWLSEPWITNLQGYSDLDVSRLDAVFKAVMAHLYIAWIHPFGDGNGRTARLIESFVLSAASVPFPATHLLSNHYNETRSEYYRQLSIASKSGGNVVPFLSYALRGLVDQLREQIGVIRAQQMELFWGNHVHTLLSDSETGRRRRCLVEDLAAHGKPVSRDDLPEISGRVVRHYVGKNDKTFARDLIELERLKLIVREGTNYRANKGIVGAFLPPRLV